MDSYEDFFDEYVSFMKKYKKSKDPTSLMSDYSKYMSQYSETMEKLNAIKKYDLTPDELALYTETMANVTKKLAEVS